MIESGRERGTATMGEKAGVTLVMTAKHRAPVSRRGRSETRTQAVFIIIPRNQPLSVGHPPPDPSPDPRSERGCIVFQLCNFVSYSKPKNQKGSTQQTR